MQKLPLEQRKKVWDGMAKNYSENVEENHMAAGITLSTMIGIPTSKNILEVGCGSGLLATYWIGRLPSGTKYTATDLSEEMIKIANERKQKLQHADGVEAVFVAADAENLENIPNESIDTYISTLCLNAMPNPEKAIQEALRVVKKGGKIGISVNSTNDKNLFQKFLRNRGREFENEELKSINKTFPTEKEELLQLAQDAGIVVDYCWVQINPYNISCDQTATTLTAFPAVKKALSEMTEADQKKFVENIRKDYEEERKDLTPITSTLLFLTGHRPE